jgi:hypothetical protein
MTGNASRRLPAKTVAVVGLLLILAMAVPASAGNSLPLRARDTAIFRTALSGVPKAKCSASRFNIVCGDSKTYYVSMRREQRCLLHIESGRYGELPTRSRWVEGC